MLNLIQFFILAFSLNSFQDSFCLGAFSRILVGDNIKPTPQKNTFTQALDIKITALMKEKEELKSPQELKNRIEKLTQEISTLKEKSKLASSSDKDIIFKKLKILNQNLYPTLIDLEQAYQQMYSILEADIQAHQEYKEDPEFKKLIIPKKSYYAFDDLENINKHLILFEEKFKQLEEKRNNIEHDIIYRKKNQTIANEDYKENKKKQEGFIAQINSSGTNNSELLANARQEGELLDTQEQAFLAKKDLADIKLREAEARLSYTDFQLDFILKNKIKLLKSEYNNIKQALKVDDSYVAQQQAKLESKKTVATNFKNHFYNQIRIYNEFKENGQKQLAIAIEDLKLQPSDLASLQDWTKPLKTVQQWISGTKIGNIIISQNGYDVHKEYIDSQVELEKNKLLEEESNLDIVQSWNKMTMHKFALEGENEIDAEIKHYETQESDIVTNLSLIVDRKNSININLNRLNRSLNNLKIKIKELKLQEDKLFKENIDDYEQVLGLLNNSQDGLVSQIDFSNKTLEAYNKSIDKLHILLKKIDNVIGELKTKSQWVQLNEVKWEQLRTFFPHIKLFLNNYQELATHYFETQNLSVACFIDVLCYYLNNTLELALIFGQILLIFIFFVLFRILLPRLSQVLLTRATISHVPRKISFFGSILTNFISKYLIILFIWAILFFIIITHMINNQFLSISFYLFSIPLYIYIIYKFFTYFRNVNREYNYVLIKKDYENRFIIVFSFLAYTSTVILFFRQAFLLVNYDSHVPTLLLAINFVAIQVALISLIRKQHILSIIPTNTSLWEWIQEHVSKYYYLLLALVISLIILSNPYLGYGKLVLPIFLRALLTVSLIPFFSWIYGYIRKISLDLFFSSDEEIIKERFTSSKTWHGIFVILTLFVFSVLLF